MAEQKKKYIKLEITIITPASLKFNKIMAFLNTEVMDKSAKAE